MELQAQIDRALKAGIKLSHLDTHMTALVGSLELFRVYQALNSKYGIPILVGDYKIPGGITLAASESLVQQVIGIDPGIPPGELVRVVQGEAGSSTSRCLRDDCASGI